MLKRRWILIAAATIAAALPALSRGQSNDKAAEGFMAMTRRPLKYDLEPRRVDVRSEVAIGTRADGSTLTIDVYLPKQSAAKPQPVVLLLHGGVPDAIPILPSRWQMYQDWGVVLAQSGVAAVMFNHRLGYPQRRIDEAMSEIAQVTQWLDKSATAYRFDSARITAVAFSAGGLVVPELVRRNDRIRGYVLFYPLLGAENNPAEDADVRPKLRFVDVLPILARRDTPILIFRSGADEVPGLLAMLDPAVTAALQQDARLELINLPRAPHSFDSVLDDPATRRAIERTIEFARGG